MVENRGYWIVTVDISSQYGYLHGIGWEIPRDKMYRQNPVQYKNPLDKVPEN